MSHGPDLSNAYRDLVRVILAFTQETEPSFLLERILTEARWFTSAEAGTLYLLENDRLHFAAIQNDVLRRHLGPEELRRQLAAEPLRLDEPSLAGHVAATGDILNLHDPHTIPADPPYDRAGPDPRVEYRARSVLVAPLPDPSGKILGVLQLMNPLDPAGAVTAFAPQYEGLLRLLASQAGAAIRNMRLEERALKDPVTEAYHRRYLVARLREEGQRHTRTGEPVSLVMVAVDDVGSIAHRLGEAAGNELLGQAARLLLRHSRRFTVMSRCGPDRFGVLLVATPKAGALAYADRIRRVFTQHAFPAGPVTASLGVACLPDDAATDTALMKAAEQAVDEARQHGGNRITAR